MINICANEVVNVAELTDVKNIFDSFGRGEMVSEYMMDAVTGVSGSSPAWSSCSSNLWRMALSAAECPANKPINFAAQAVLGSAKMVLETGKHQAN